MRVASDWFEVAGVTLALIGLLGLRIHISCDMPRCWRREVFPSGYCRKHQPEGDPRCPASK